MESIANVVILDTTKVIYKKRVKWSRFAFHDIIWDYRQLMNVEESISNIAMAFDLLITQ